MQGAGIEATWVWRWMAQGLAVAAVVALTLRLRPAMSAATRGLVWWSALLAVLALGIMLATGLEPSPVGSGLASVAGAIDRFASAPAALSSATPTVTLALLWLWGVMATIRVGRLAVGVATLRRWRRRCHPIDSAFLQQLPVWTGLRDTGRHASVVLSPDVQSPCVLGMWSPFIALPPSALMLSAPALDAVLVHEYAHVQRRDDVAQFLQHVISALCACHPAVWWMSRMLTIEREAACDDWVVVLAAPRQAYAACLQALAAGQRVDTALLHLSVNGGRSQLARRVQRLIDARRTRQLRSTGMVRTIAPAVVIVLAGVVSVAGGSRDAGSSAMTHVPTIQPRATAAAAPPSGAQLAAGADGGSILSVAPLTLTASPAPRGRDVATAPRDQTAPALERAGEASSPSHVVDEGGAVPLAASTPLLTSPVASAVSPHRPAPFLGGNTSAETRTSTANASAGGPFVDAGVAVADAGVAIGKGAARGGVATGGFFTRFGKRVAQSF